VRIEALQGSIIMAKKRKMWVYGPPRAPKPKVADGIKASVERKAMELVETVLEPEYIKPPPDEELFNYVVDIYTKWKAYQRELAELENRAS
jgi:hypothetical protein